MARVLAGIALMGNRESTGLMEPLRGIAVASPNAEELRSVDRNIARQHHKHRTVLQPRLWARRRAYRKLVETAAVA